jgi:hypothetical protein
MTKMALGTELTENYEKIASNTGGSYLQPHPSLDFFFLTFFNALIQMHLCLVGKGIL